MSTDLRVLIVEDSEDDVVALVRRLRQGEYEPDYERVDTAHDMQAALSAREWDIIISDYNMPSFSAPAALGVLQESGLDLPFIIVSGVIGEDEAVAAMRIGAQDYMMKDNLARLVPAVRRELKEAEERRQRKSLEDQLQQSQKMESLGRLAGGVAHDFNNLLTSILGHAQLAAMELPDSHPIRGHIEEIEKAGERASNLTHQLLTVSRHQTIEPKVINLNFLIVDMSNMLHHLIGDNIELVALPKPDLGLVKVDHGQFEQVLMNLVLNARDALPSGGKIIIETANVYMDDAKTRQYPGASAGPHVVLSVSDNGTGMSDAIRSHIFEPFFTTKEEGKGTGLGLATCYGIVKQSGGHIQVFSKIGQGTTFKIYLPQAEESVVAGIDETPRKHHLMPGKETVLLAEDEPLVQSMIANMLQDLGYVVLQASNGNEAMRLAQEHADDEIHLLLTDMVMPQMGGIELANKLGSIRPNTKILFTSGYPDESIIRETMPDPMVQFIQKPFAAAALSYKVREMLDFTPR